MPAVGQSFRLYLLGAPQGLTVTLALLNTDDETIELPATIDVAELAQDDGTSNYRAEVVADSDAEAGTYQPTWYEGGDIIGEDVELVEITYEPIVPVEVGDAGGIVLDAPSVRLSTAELMAYRLKAGGFAAGRGGTATQDFTENTTPTLLKAVGVTVRNAALVSDDFPYASVGDEPELRTIAALRSAIELENSLDTPNFERIREWRLQLREHVERVDGGAGDGDGPTQGGRTLEALWSFGAEETRIPGSEEPYSAITADYRLVPESGRRRRVW